MARRSGDFSQQGMYNAEVPYDANNPEHMKRMQYGGQGYEFASPFAFSAGEAQTTAVAQPMAPAGFDQGRRYSNPQMYEGRRWSNPQISGPQITAVVAVSAGTGPPPQPNAQYGTNNVAVQEHLGSTYGISQHNVYAKQPPPQQYCAPPPMQYAPPPMQKGGPPPPPTQLEGWLAKRSDGGLGSPWLMRWWKLENGTMRYSREEKGNEAGRVDISAKTEVRPIAHPNATVEGRMMSPKKPFAFEIHNGAGARTYYLDAGSREKMDLWIRALMGAITQMRGAGKGGGPWQKGYGGGW